MFRKRTNPERYSTIFVIATGCIGAALASFGVAGAILLIAEVFRLVQGF